MSIYHSYVSKRNRKNIKARRFLTKESSSMINSGKINPLCSSMQRINLPKDELTGTFKNLPINYNIKAIKRRIDRSLNPHDRNYESLHFDDDYDKRDKIHINLKKKTLTGVYKKLKARRRYLKEKAQRESMMNDNDGIHSKKETGLDLKYPEQDYMKGPRAVQAISFQTDTNDLPTRQSKIFLEREIGLLSKKAHKSSMSN